MALTAFWNLPWTPAQGRSRPSARHQTPNRRPLLRVLPPTTEDRCPSLAQAAPHSLHPRRRREFVLESAWQNGEFRKRMLGWLRRFTHPHGQFDPYLVRKRLRPVQVRAYTAEDFEACVELYRLNEPGRFPPGHLPEFERTLRDGKHLFLILEEEGKIVGCGGISINRYEMGVVVYGIQAWLFFGLIHPQSHRRGLGSALLLARLAMLPPAEWWPISLQAVPTSRSFYETLGFRFDPTMKYEGGAECSAMCAYLNSADRKLCDTLLRDAGVTLPSIQPVVPVTMTEIPATFRGASEPV
jgi:GNAT superfamily N-acetyltransferase